MTDTQPSHNDTTSQAASNNDSASQPNATEFKKVNIVIAGKDYPINCPVNEEQELRKAVYFINNFVQDIKKEAPHLNQENLLVLCCLNLFEQMNSQQQSSDDQREISQEAATLLNKILKDAQSMVR